jgi:hypothetical protein
LSKSMKPNYRTIMNKNFILTELFLRKSRIMKSDIVTLVENRAFVEAFCRGRVCTRDKWHGHVAPKPF